MLPDAAKHPALPQDNLHMPSKADVPITHVLAICTLRVQELQRAALLLPGISWTKEKELYLHALAPCHGCVTTHLASVLGAESSLRAQLISAVGLPVCCGVFSFQFQSACQCWHWSPFDLPFRAQTDWGYDCSLQLQPCERSLSKSSHLLNYPFTEVICTAVGGETWTPRAPHSFIRWNEAKKARSVSVHAAYKLQSPHGCHCPDYTKMHSLPSTWSPLSVSALHILAGGSLLAFVTTSNREMGTTAKSHTTESTTHAPEIGFLHSWCIIWESPQPPDIFWWKSILVRRQNRNRWKKIT